jgi:DNA-binding NarL/FixJ family response regulator
LRSLVMSVLGEVHVVEAEDGASLMEAARAQPEAAVALVDLNMPGMERGFRLGELATRHPRLPVIVISALTSPDIVRRTLQVSSVHAFIAKSAPIAHTCEALHAAMRGIKLPFSWRSGAVHRPDTVLTPRMEEIRSLLRQGMSNKLIASTLGISEGTVKNHMSEIFRALNVTNRTQAAQFDAETS